MIKQSFSGERESTPLNTGLDAKAPALRLTALNVNHRARGAKMVPFAGWEMPLQYGRILEEHQAVRQAAGLFDISHMGLIVVKSGDRGVSQAFLELMTPRSLAKLYPGKAVYTQLLNEQGGIIDDILLYSMPESEHLSGFQEFLLIVNAANTEADAAWLRRHADSLNCKGLVIEVLAEASEGPSRYSLFALQGPQFADVLARTGYDTDQLPERFHIAEAKIQGTPVWLSRTGYTGEDGVEIIVPSAQAVLLWDLLLELGRPNGVKPIGLGARDTLRLEAAYPLHGHDITENDTPLEAGLEWSVTLNKKASFIGQEALLKQKDVGLTRHLYCFTVNHRSIARQEDRIFKNGVDVGVVTSGSISPLFNEPIGMGYIRSGVVFGPGDTIQLRIRDNYIDADIVERPFYQPSESV
jgi:aminomethyltransferase